MNTGPGVQLETVMFCIMTVMPGCVHRGEQPGVAQKSTLFLHKNVFEYKV